MKIRDTSATDNVRPRPRGLKKYTLPALGLVTVMAATFLVTGESLGRWLSSDGTYELERLRIAEVSRGRFEHSISAEGRIVAVVEPTLFATTDGYASLMVTAGDRVHKGQVVAEIDNDELRSEYKLGLSQVEKAEIEHNRLKLSVALDSERVRQDLRVAEIRYEAAARRAERHRTPEARQAISLQQLEEVFDELRVAEAEYQSLKTTSELLIERLQYDVRANELELERQKALVHNLARQVDQLSVKSPIDGLVGSVLVKHGDSVRAYQPLMNVVDLSAYGVELSVPESYANDLSVGMPVVISYEGKSYPGELSSVSAEVNDSDIEARAVFVETPAGQLRQNQRVSLKIVLDHADDVLTVQRGPFIDSGAGHFAYLVQGNIATRVPITLDAVSVSQAVIASGLNAGDRIVISDTAVFNNAERVLLR